VQSLSTQSDVAGSLVCLNVPACLVTDLPTPVSATNPLPIVPTPNMTVLDGSGTMTVGGTAQTLFGGVKPVNGYLICNTSTATL
jgi:hypothetical protein